MLNNLIYDLSELGIPFDAADPDDLAPAALVEHALGAALHSDHGPTVFAFRFATFAWLRLLVHADIATFRTAWFVESTSTHILVIFLIRTAGPAWHSRPHRVLVATSLGALLVALLVAASPPIGAIFGFGGLNPGLGGGTAVITLGYLACAEAGKRLVLAAREGMLAVGLSTDRAPGGRRSSGPWPYRAS